MTFCFFVMKLGKIVRNGEKSIISGENDFLLFCDETGKNRQKW